MSVLETALFKRHPDHGHDPWLGPRIPEEVNQETILQSQRLYTGADTLSGDINLMPSGLNVYMSYVDNFGGWNELVRRFGPSGAKLISITIFGNRARCADVEPGAMHESSLPNWLDRVTIRDNLLPWVYTSAGNMSKVNGFIGGRKVIRWSAHYGFGPHVCGPHTCGYPQADWTQWTDTGPQGQNFDRSVGLILPGPPPPPPDPNHYNWFSGTLRIHGGQVINERNTVIEYDRRRPHRILNMKRLRVLELRSAILANNVFNKAHEEKDSHGHPSWDKYHRGWRYQQLIHRSEGKRLV